MSTVEPAVVPGPVESSGFSLLRPRAEMDRMRRSFERPTAIGRYALVALGAVTLGSGAGLVLAHYATIAFAILAFGLVLMALGAVQHLFYTQGKAHWPTEMSLHDSGVELLLHNGEIRAVEWSDPKIDLEILLRIPKAGAPPEATLMWRMDRKVPPCPLSAAGFERLEAAIAAHGLQIQEFRRGPRTRETRVIEVGPPPKKSMPKSPADWGP